MRSVHSAIESRFKVGGTLPGQVFRRPEQLGFMLTDNAFLTFPEAGRFLGELESRFGRGALIAAVITDRQEPGGQAAPLPVLKLPISGARTGLRAWLDYEATDRTEPLYIYAKEVAITGLSGQWGLWVDQSSELAILGVATSRFKSVRTWFEKAFDWPWSNAAELESMLAPSFDPNEVPAPFLRALQGSYG